VCKTSRPGKNRCYAVGAGFTSFLVNPIMAGNRAMGCFSFDCLSIRAHLEFNRNCHIKTTKREETDKRNLKEDKNEYSRYTNTEVINPRDPNPIRVKKRV